MLLRDNTEMAGSWVALTLTLGASSSHGSRGGIEGGQVLLRLHEALGGGPVQRLRSDACFLGIQAIVTVVGGVLGLLVTPGVCVGGGGGEGERCVGCMCGGGRGCVGGCGGEGERCVGWVCVGGRGCVCMCMEVSGFWHFCTSLQYHAMCSI